MEIRKTLVLSTAHLSAETRELLDEMQDLPKIANHDYGWYFWVPPAGQYDLWASEWEIPDDLDSVLRFACDNDINEVKFDCDAEIVPTLPVYED